MFTRTIPIFRLFGFQIKLDFTWTFLAVLVTWSLASGLFPEFLPDASESLYWMLGVLGALGLFASIVLHELGHAVVARKYGIPISGITLFIFGGVAEMEEEPPNARSELLMAIAGPITSLLLAVCAYLAGVLLGMISVGVPVLALLWYLTTINLLLAVFNLIPAFPLDGGRVLRASLWAWRKDLRKATRISSEIGGGFGIALIALGIFAFIKGNVLMGVWWFLIGTFMRTASLMSYKQLLIRRALEGERVRRFMKTNVVAVGPGNTVLELVEEYIYKYHYKMYPVVAGERLVGFVTMNDARSVPQDDWPTTSIDEIMHPCEPDHLVAPGEDAMHALSIMSRTQNSRLMVIEDDRLVGIVALRDLLGFLSVKMDLEGGRAHL